MNVKQISLTCSTQDRVIQPHKIDICIFDQFLVKYAKTEEMVTVPVQDRWSLPYLSTLLSQRREAYNMTIEDEEKRLTDLIDSLVIS